MILKIHENLRTASFSPKFTDGYKKKKCNIDLEMWEIS